MTRIDARTFALGGNALLASALVAVVYVQGPPVIDIEAYPAVVYGGVNVYYVDGRWYQRGPRGWAYYRQEPPALGRQREEHWGRDHDPRWGVHGGTEHRPRSRGVA